MKKIIFMLTAFLFAGISCHAWAFTEPNINDYTNVPIFQVNAVKPNIMIILDNSGSMNFNAYGSYPGDNSAVPETYPCLEDPGVITRRVSQSADDAEEQKQGTYFSIGHSYYNSPDLDLARYKESGSWNKTYVGVRFQNIAVPKGRTIKRAYIQFTGWRRYDYTGEATSLRIHGQAADTTAAFGTSAFNISSRPQTTASVDWINVPDWATDQFDNATKSPDLKTIIQEIVDRDGWQKNNSMAFIIEGIGDVGKRDAYAWDQDPNKAPLLHIEFEPEAEDECPKFYGYFDPDARYTYSSNVFVRDPSGAWCGNWLNWCVMRRVDVLRKVIMGGLATSRTGGGNQTNICETPAQSNRVFWRLFNGDSMDVLPTPYSGSRWYRVGDGYLDVYNPGSSSRVARFTLKVKKDVNHEPQDFHEGNLAGVLQKVGDKARWGNMWFYYGDGKNKSGGYVQSSIGTNMTSLITDLQNVACDTWTPLGETYYVAMQYFKQEAPDSSLDFFSNAIGSTNNVNDPYYHDAQFIHCADSFVIYLTDGAPTMDRNLPEYLKDYAKDLGYRGTRSWVDNGSDYLADVALYARRNDLRADLDGPQNLILYMVYAFDDDENAREMIMEAAKNGGFNDINGNMLPDLQTEWDRTGDGIPDNFYDASDGYKLEAALIRAINDILKRAGSGTAVSVLATRGEGEGTLTQAFFRPTVPVGQEEIKWTGYLQSLWVDPYGNMREDSNSNHTLDLDQDKIVRFFLDENTGETRVKLYPVSGDAMYPGEDSSYISVNLDEINPIFEAGDLLADRIPDERNIFTSIDNSTSFLEFTDVNASDLQDYLGVESSSKWSYLGDTFERRVNNLIHYIRGEEEDSPSFEGTHSMRSRTMEDGRLWRLGDIVYSTPVSISGAVEKYSLLYDDSSYRSFMNKYGNRETVVYVGANDGKLHAFTSGVYVRQYKRFLKPSDVGGFTGEAYLLPDVLGIGDVEIGDELWAYIPKALLPHLKWLPDPDYTHVSYVDLKPKIIDVKIFDSDDIHPGGWGTVLVSGLNFGGKEIETQNAGTFTPSYFALDITNPRDPKLLWEKTYSNLGLTINEPAVIKVGEEWYLAIGSGPTNFSNMGNDVVSTQKAKLFIVDLETGELLQDFEVEEANSYFNPPVSLDKMMNYNVDAIYAGTTYLDKTFKGRMHKIIVPQGGSEFNPYSTDYKVDPATWSRVQLFDSPAPFAGPFTLSVDRRENTWVYGGTGRYIENSDKTSTQQNYIFGIKDPFFNPDGSDENLYKDCYRDYSIGTTDCKVDFSDLFDARPYIVRSDGTVEGGLEDVDTFRDLVLEARQANYHGWYRELCSGGISSSGACLTSGPSERVLQKPGILGGILLVPTFAPDDDICGFGGSGRMFALYYETGTAYRRRIVGDPAQETILDVVYLGQGLSSSFGVHLGKQEGGMIFGQMSTGEIVEVDVTPAFVPVSTPIYWKELPGLW